MTAVSEQIGTWLEQFSAQPCSPFQDLRDAGSELDSKLAALQALVIMARRESQRLERLLGQATDTSDESLATRPDPLAAIEGLADPAAMADPHALEKATAQSRLLPLGVPVQIWDEDRRGLNVAHLADQGHAATDIARQLGLALGDVELLLSLRPAR